MLPAKHRLKSRKVFSGLFQTGKGYSNEMFFLRLAKGDAKEPSQFGFAASLKFSKKAAERNRVKRWMREAVRAKISEIKPGYSVVFLINSKFPKENLDFENVSKEINNLLKKAKILR